jgi:hypothetical protein
MPSALGLALRPENGEHLLATDALGARGGENREQRKATRSNVARGRRVSVDRKAAEGSEPEHNSIPMWLR